ncbi:BamA/TamA family outer membrane protein [Flavihumibacter profundi]|uniref:BamA/TamA family outer membrane protein n=1 Tax=Flavihumibacter profundi TaxID=2716883 RepID=UPI001CC7728E|nr:BamA/TamA family outer membrane protein [Flavihumibacter profundi]MBZ5856653.1 BamA/TamA family outer membrane protein [Flavihumibacter profundi]
MAVSITKTLIRNFHWRMLFGLGLLLLTGCKVTKNYPPNKPFVYKTKFTLNTKLPQTERSDLLDKMENQLDDSIKVKWVTKLFVKQILNKPPAFDTANAIKSVKYIQDLLRASGYLYSSVDWDSSLSVKNDEKRVIVSFKVATGKVLRFDSISYAFRDSILQGIAIKNRDKSILKKGDTFTKEKISREIDRMLGIYRDNGYLKINREDIYAEVDTVVSALIDPGLDPFEQVRLLQEVQKRRENPLIDVVLKQRGTKNPEHLQQYTIRNVRIYPDLQLVQDTVPIVFDTIRKNGISILDSRHLFKPSFLVRNNYLIPGALFKQKDLYRTNNVFGQMGAWQRVGVDVFPVDSVAAVDVNINMFPAKKQGLNVALEASSNASELITSSNLFGLGVNFGLRDKNVNKQSIQSSTNLRFGIELGNKARVIQTVQTSLAQSFIIPKFVTPFPIKAEKDLLSTHTILNANGSYTDRHDFYAVQSLNTSIGYDWTNKKNRNWLYSPLNIEFVRVFSTDSLDKLFDSIPNLRNSFNDGLIISQYLRRNNTWTVQNKLFNLRLQGEESGALFGLIKKWDLQGQLSRYVRADVDFRYYTNHPRHTWAFRVFAGMGVPYGNQIDSLGNISRETNLPFFKSYFAGGPSSMRAWQVRQLGPGSSKIFANTNADRFADIQFESNIEYRFTLGTVFGIKVKSAFFTDIGNIWYRNNQGNPELDDTVFKLNKLYKDLAMAGGTSLRLDFNYFIIRFDWAYKLKDPFYAEINDGWFYNLNLTKGQFQLGINYPF